MVDKSILDALKDLSDGHQSFRDSYDRRLSQLEVAMNRPTISWADNSDSLNEQKKAVGAFARDAQPFSRNNGMSTDTSVDGGYLTFPAVSSQMTKRIHDQSPIRRLSRVIELESGVGWQEPVDKDDIGAVWVGERQQRTATGSPKIGLLNFPLLEQWAQIPLTQKLMDTSPIALGDWVVNKISDKMAREEGTQFVWGTGTLKPEGFLTKKTSTAPDASRLHDVIQYIPSGSASGIEPDALRNLFWSLRAPHRPKATFVMSSATANAIDKMKDANDSYIWRNSSAAGVPPTLLGAPVCFDENMPDIEDGACPIAFADWQAGYAVIDLKGLRFVRDDLTCKPYVLIDCYRRVGGGVANADAIKLLKIAVN